MNGSQRYDYLGSATIFSRNKEQARHEKKLKEIKSRMKSTGVYFNPQHLDGIRVHNNMKVLNNKFKEQIKTQEISLSNNKILKKIIEISKSEAPGYIPKPAQPSGNQMSTSPVRRSYFEDFDKIIRENTLLSNKISNIDSQLSNRKMAQSYQLHYNCKKRIQRFEIIDYDKNQVKLKAQDMVNATFSAGCHQTVSRSLSRRGPNFPGSSITTNTQPGEEEGAQQGGTIVPESVNKNNQSDRKNEGDEDAEFKTQQSELHATINTGKENKAEPPASAGQPASQDLKTIEQPIQNPRNDSMTKGGISKSTPKSYALAGGFDSRGGPKRVFKPKDSLSQSLNVSNSNGQQQQQQQQLQQIPVTRRLSQQKVTDPQSKERTANKQPVSPIKSSQASSLPQPRQFQLQNGAGNGGSSSGTSGNISSTSNANNTRTPTNSNAAGSATQNGRNLSALANRSTSQSNKQYRVVTAPSSSNSMHPINGKPNTVGGQSNSLSSALAAAAAASKSKERVAAGKGAPASGNGALQKQQSPQKKQQQQSGSKGTKNGVVNEEENEYEDENTFEAAIDEVYDEQPQDFNLDADTQLKFNANRSNFFSDPKKSARKDEKKTGKEQVVPKKHEEDDEYAEDFEQQ